MSPPKVRFLTKIYHPNIGKLLGCHSAQRNLNMIWTRRQTGQNLLRYSERWDPRTSGGFVVTDFERITAFVDKWSPALQIRTVLLSIQALLSAPNPDDPLATDVAKHYKEDEKDAQRVSREWTEKYASN